MVGVGGFALVSYPGKLPLGSFFTNDGTWYVYKRSMYVAREHVEELSREHGYELN
jgi:hypothetical protein